MVFLGILIGCSRIFLKSCALQMLLSKREFLAGFYRSCTLGLWRTELATESQFSAGSLFFPRTKLFKNDFPNREPRVHLPIRLKPRSSSLEVNCQNIQPNGKIMQTEDHIIALIAKPTITKWRRRRARAFSWWGVNSFTSKHHQWILLEFTLRFIGFYGF